MRNASRTVSTVLTLALSGCAIQIGSPTTTTNAEPLESYGVVELVRVIDGDSIEFGLDGDVVEVRLTGGNAPELFNDDNQKTCNGNLAKVALEQLLDSGPISVSGNETDRFGRLLADVSVGEVNVVDELIGQGWLLATGDDESRRDLMRQADRAKTGMFSSECGLPVIDKLLIGEVQENPEGNDKFNLKEEWVELHNNSEETIDLNGWVLRDSTTGHRFDLSGSVLEPQGRLKVRSGMGIDDAQNRYLNESFPVWSNEFETVLLIDPNGVVAQVKFLVGERS